MCGGGPLTDVRGHVRCGLLPVRGRGEDEGGPSVFQESGAGAGEVLSRSGTGRGVEGERVALRGGGRGEVAASVSVGRSLGTPRTWG